MKNKSLGGGRAGSQTSLALSLFAASSSAFLGEVGPEGVIQSRDSGENKETPSPLI